MKIEKLPDRFAGIGLMTLPIVTAWLFVPQLANAFDIKHHVSILGAIAVALALIGYGARNALVLPKGLIGGGLLVWSLAVAVSAVSAENSYLATGMFFEVAAFLLLAIAIFNMHVDAALRNLETGIIVAGAGVAVFALKQYFLPDVLDPGFSAIGKMTIYSTLGNSNLAALIILASVPLAAWRAFGGEAISRIGYAGIALLLLAGVLTTQARHALIAIGVMGVVALLWLGSRYLRRKVLGGFLIVTCVGVAILLYIDLPPSVIHSLKGRWFIWLTSLQMLWEHPFAGVGLGHFGINHMAYQGAHFASGQFDAYVDNASIISEGHNDFLNWGAMTGMLGLIGFTTLCAGTLWKGWHSSTLRQGAPQLYLALVGYIVAMLFVSVTSYTAPALFFWLLFGMILARSDIAKAELSPPTWIRHVFVAFMVTLLIVGSHQAWREVNGGWHEAQGDRLMEQHDLWLAEKEYQQALLWIPNNSGLLKRHATDLFLAGELRQALSELEKAKHGSGDLGIYMLEGEIRTRLGDLDDAVATYRKITTSFPNMVGPHFILGQIYQLQGKRNDAETEFRKVLNIKPSPFNLNMTAEKVELQKRIVRDYLYGSRSNPAQAVELPSETGTQD